ncbi:DUF674 family protein [Trifolium pratense]|uniref:DUF674 family protein n=1 Tax=Trifolium pratense TaxID=57577 RepID=A0A2K3L8A7_TRIPR|nr:DUF674 family protein [Trifolium pratense]
MAENSSAEHVDKVTLRVLVDKEKNKVVYAEAGKDFVDVLFSFLTLPLGTIARLVAKESNIEAVRFGSISSLYQSVSDLDEQYLWSKTCKDMLLMPRNSMGGYCKNMKLNIDDTEPLQSCYLYELVVTPMSSIDGISYLERMKVLLDDVEEMVINIGQKEGLSILKASLSSTSALTNGLNQYLGSSTLKKPKEESEA